jgi:hypothetical protein
MLSSRVVTALHPHGNPEASASQRRDPGAAARSATLSLGHHEQQSSPRRANQPSSSNQRRRSRLRSAVNSGGAVRATA